MMYSKKNKKAAVRSSRGSLWPWEPRACSGAARVAMLAAAAESLFLAAAGNSQARGGISSSGHPPLYQVTQYSSGRCQIGRPFWESARLTLIKVSAAQRMLREDKEVLGFFFSFCEFNLLLFLFFLIKSQSFVTIIWHTLKRLSDCFDKQKGERGNRILFWFGLGVF